MLITHEWIEMVGGSENVFRELLDTFPDAAAGCLWNNAPGSLDRPVVESRLANSPLRGRKALSLALQPGAWRDFPLGDHAVVLSSSHAFGHHLAGRAAREGRRGYSYVHSPARYIWAPEVEERGRGFAARVGSVALKYVDRRATDSRVAYAANSRFIRERILRSWDVDASVIYPPVDVERIQAVATWRDVLAGRDSALLDRLPGEGFVLGASRLVAYKRLDLVIDVASALGMPVVIAGTGPEEAALRAHAADTDVPVIFVGAVSDEQLYALYQEASLYVFLPVEDFGIMPVEAMAAGCPVLVNTVGGASESVGLVGGGLAVDAGWPSADLATAASEAMSLDPSAFASRAMAFSRSAFRDRVTTWVGGEAS